MNGIISAWKGTIIDETKIKTVGYEATVTKEGEEVLDIAVTPEDVVLVMEFIPGATLSEIRRARKRLGERLPFGFRCVNAAMTEP